MLDNTQQYDVIVTGDDQGLQETAKRTNSTFERMEAMGNRAFRAIGTSAAMARLMLVQMYEDLQRSDQKILDSAKSNAQLAKELASLAVAYGSVAASISKYSTAAGKAGEVTRYGVAAARIYFDTTIATASSVLTSAIVGEVTRELLTMTYRKADTVVPMVQQATKVIGSESLRNAPTYWDDPLMLSSGRGRIMFDAKEQREQVTRYDRAERFQTSQLSEIISQYAGIERDSLDRIMETAYKDAMSKAPTFATYTHDLKGNARKPTDVLETYISRLESIQDPFEQVAKANNIFGKDAGVVLAQLNKGFVELAESAKHSGQVITDVDARNLAEFKRDIDSLVVSVKSLWGSLDVVPSKIGVSTWIAGLYHDIKQELQFKDEAQNRFAEKNLSAIQAAGGMSGPMGFADETNFVPVQQKPYDTKPSLLGSVVGAYSANPFDEQTKLFMADKLAEADSLKKPTAAKAIDAQAQQFIDVANNAITKYRQGREGLATALGEAKASQAQVRKLLEDGKMIIEGDTGKVDAQGNKIMGPKEFKIDENMRYLMSRQLIDANAREADTKNQLRSLEIQRSQLTSGFSAEAAARSATAGYDPISKLIAEQRNKIAAESRVIDEDNIVHNFTLSPATLANINRVLVEQVKEMTRKAQDQLLTMRAEFSGYIAQTNRDMANQAADLSLAGFTDSDRNLQSAFQLVAQRAKLESEIRYQQQAELARDLEIRRKYTEERTGLDKAYSQASSPTAKQAIAERIQTARDTLNEQLDESGRKSADAITRATNSYTLAVAEVRKRLAEETQKLDEDTRQKAQAFEGTSIGTGRDQSLGRLELEAARVVDVNPRAAALRRIEIEQQKLSITMDYARKTTEFESQEIDRRIGKEKEGLLHSLAVAPVENQRAILDQLMALDRSAAEAHRELAIKTEDEIAKYQQDSLIRQTDIARSMYEKQFNSIKDSAGHIFDTLSEGNFKGFGDVLKKTVIGGLLAPVRESFSSTIASIFTPGLNNFGAPQDRAKAAVDHNTQVTIDNTQAMLSLNSALSGAGGAGGLGVQRLMSGEDGVAPVLGGGSGGGLSVRPISWIDDAMAKIQQYSDLGRKAMAGGDDMSQTFGAWTAPPRTFTDPTTGKPIQIIESGVPTQKNLAAFVAQMEKQLAGLDKSMPGVSDDIKSALAYLKSRYPRFSSQAIDQVSELPANMAGNFSQRKGTITLAPDLDMADAISAYAHESTHARQANKLGKYWKQGYDTLNRTYGYDANPMEVHAYEAGETAQRGFLKFGELLKTNPISFDAASGFGAMSLGDLGLGPGGTSGFAGPLAGYGGGAGAGGFTLNGLGSGLGLGTGHGGGILGQLTGIGKGIMGPGGLTKLKDLFYNSGSIATGAGSATTAAGIGGLKGTMAGVLTSQGSAALMTAVGVPLAMSGLLGNDRGTGKGILKGALGGALTGAGIGTMIMPGLGTLIGAGVGALAGFGIGLGEKIFGVESPRNHAKNLVRQLYGGLEINNGMADLIVQTAQSKYGGAVSVAVRDPEIRKNLELYAAATGHQFPQSASTPRAGSTFEIGGQMFQGPSYQYGRAYTLQSSLPTIGGMPTGSAPTPNAGPMSLSISVGGEGAGQFVAGKVVSPEFVQARFRQAQSSSNGRLSNAAVINQPGLIIS